MTNGEKLKKWIKDTRLRREEVCTLVGMSVGTLRKMLMDDPTVHADYWKKIFELMERPAASLYRAVS